MDGKRVPAAQGRDRARKRPGRRARGPVAIERDGYWHAVGTVRVDGRSIRIRKSLGLAVAAASADQADTAIGELVDEIKARVSGKAGRGDPVSIATERYLIFPRARVLRPSTIVIVLEIARRFGERRLNDIDAPEWIEWIDGSRDGAKPGRMSGRKSSTRERFLNGVVGFLNFAKAQHGLGALPVFRRDNAARNPNRRTRRRVADLRPDLIQLLFDTAHITLRAQLVVEYATGARVSSVLHGARICDLILAKGREKIVFPETKNGQDVVAALNPTAVAVLKDYLKWRGKLHDREAPLFLTWRRQPYIDNGRTGGGQNKTGFNGAKRRACKLILDRAAAEAARLARRGKKAAAEEVSQKAAADAALLAKVTQHWFRHLLATRWIRRDPRAAMEQAGWLDIRSVMGYAQDVPEYRQELAVEMDEVAKRMG